MMKKSLIALAAVAATGAAMAQSSVSIYGVLDVGIGKLKGGKLGVQNGETYGLTTAPAGAKDGFNSTSVIGFRGSEDLGGGLRANFNLQSGGLDLGGGGTLVAFSREATVGLAGKFGEVQLGRSASIAAKTMGGFDLNGTSGSSALALASVSAVTWYASSRRSDQIQYVSPNMGGVTVRLGYSFEGDATANGNAVPATAESSLSAGATYAAGPLTIGGIWEGKRAAANRDAYAIGASYNLGFATVAATYNRREAVGTLGFNGMSIRPGNIGGGKGYSIGARVPMGAFTIGAQYATNSDTKGKATELFANYALSKRTRVYFDYVTLSGMNAVATSASTGFTSVGIDAIPANPNAFGLGIVHTF